MEKGQNEKKNKFRNKQDVGSLFNIPFTVLFRQFKCMNYLYVFSQINGQS